MDEVHHFSEGWRKTTNQVEIDVAKTDGFVRGRWMMVLAMKFGLAPWRWMDLVHQNEKVRL